MTTHSEFLPRERPEREANAEAMHRYYSAQYRRDARRSIWKAFLWAVAIIGLFLLAAAAADARPLPPIYSAQVRHCTLIGGTLCEAVHDRPVVTLLLVHTAAIITDGYYTNRNIKHGMVELDPVSILFIGRHPTWKRMAPVGAAWIIGETYLAERVRHSRYKVIRQI